MWHNLRTNLQTKAIFRISTLLQSFKIYVKIMCLYAFVLMDTVSYNGVNCYKAKIHSPTIRCLLYICFYSFSCMVYNKLSTRLHAQMSLKRAFMLSWFYNGLYLYTCILCIISYQRQIRYSYETYTIHVYLYIYIYMEWRICLRSNFPELI